MLPYKRFSYNRSVLVFPVNDVLLGGPDEECELGGLIDVDVLVEHVRDPEGVNSMEAQQTFQQDFQVQTL